MFLAHKCVWVYVADVEIGSENYSVISICKLSVKEQRAIGISLAGGANALKLVKPLVRVWQRWIELPSWSSIRCCTFIEHDAICSFDPIEQVVMTLLEAIVLVFIVMFIFLQNLACNDYSNARCTCSLTWYFCRTLCGWL